MALTDEMQNMTWKSHVHCIVLQCQGDIIRTWAFRKICQATELGFKWKKDGRITGETELLENLKENAKAVKPNENIVLEGKTCLREANMA